jgi:hypothetical protein
VLAGDYCKLEYQSMAISHCSSQPSNDGAGRLETKFVSKDQTTDLMQVLELALEDLDHVAGGECSCVNCCSHAARVLRA